MYATFLTAGTPADVISINETRFQSPSNPVGTPFCNVSVIYCLLEVITLPQNDNKSVILLAAPLPRNTSSPADSPQEYLQSPPTQHVIKKRICNTRGARLCWNEDAMKTCLPRGAGISPSAAAAGTGGRRGSGGWGEGSGVSFRRGGAKAHASTRLLKHDGKPCAGVGWNIRKLIALLLTIILLYISPWSSHTPGYARLAWLSFLLLL